MRKWLLLPLLLLAAAAPVHGFVEFKAKSGILIDADSGRVLFARNEHRRFPPASLTKVMTMLLIMENIDSGRARLSEPIRTSRYAESIGGSQVYLKEGETFSLAKMLECIAVVSANDASAAVAEALYGGTDEFVGAMNRKAKELGAKDTHFANESGLPAPNHYSSAYDMALFARELVTKHPGILRWTSEKTGSLRGGKFILRNTNKLLWTYPGSDGLKTGHTEEAGFCLVATAKRGGMRLISVEFGAPTENDRLETSRKMLEYGFRNFIRKVIGRKGQTVGKVLIKNAAGRVPAKLGRDLTITIRREEASEIRKKLVVAAKPAPLPAGATVGRMLVQVRGAEVGSAPLITDQAVPRANIFIRLLRALLDWFARLFGRK